MSFVETITAERYQEILGLFIGELHENELETGYFQHDIAPTDIARQTSQYHHQHSFY